MRFRKLRIAFSATCLVACALLIALRVRSRYAIDDFGGPLLGSLGFGFMSRSGGLGLILRQQVSSEWFINTWSTMEISTPPYQTALGFVEYLVTPDAYRVRVPYWFLVSLSATFATLPWLRRRFILRTLLIATTLVAVMLGLIAYVTKK